MAYRDRLAASRAQREQPIELSGIPQVQTPVTASTPGGGLSDLAAFLAEDTSIQNGIQQMRDNVAQIAALRTQSLNAIDDSTHNAGRIDELTSETRVLMQELKERIRQMESTPSRHDVQLRNNRLAVLRTKFLEALQDYQREEQESRAKAKQRVERQLLIVKPDATREEVAAAIDGGGGQQIFAQALTNSTRYGESRAAYREVQERQEDLKRVERTLAELAQLFSDMATLVEQQDAVINNVEQTAQNVTVDTRKALENTDQAVVHARSYRRSRWICFGIFVLVLVILAIVLGVVFGRK
ncbi:Syntaxin-like protein psy1 [Psilocybe cubensis]|uniref:t-SNARE coiled-coil homology domain-containing protein n=2 Tax=Psilocybe cubensis TaxID=181762 RepID=A0A8H8CM77_PSICU|nr:Syntaxin-like protein psy1 [Psilocybe cubensis]KAH9484218.1 Syntaxin-like protein psy1 [Psilocybe cubensis]